MKLGCCLTSHPTIEQFAVVFTLMADFYPLI